MLEMPDILEIYKERKITDNGLNSVIDSTMLNIAPIQARGYNSDPKMYINRFFNNDTQRHLCAWIVTTFRHLGILEQCTQLKDFTEWADRQPVEDRWKKVLANTMSIIYSIIYEPQQH